LNALSLAASLGPGARSEPMLPVATRPLRVALVTGSYNYIRDGVALSLNRLVDFLIRAGVDVLVFAPVGPAPAFEPVGELVPVRSVPLPFRPEYRVALGLPRSPRQRLSDFAPDIIHIATPDLLGLAVLRYARGEGVPVVASYHTRYETYLRHYGLGFATATLARYLRNFYSSCRELYVPSDSMAQTLSAEGLEVAMKPWPRGVDTAHFHPSRRSEEWRRRFGILPDVPVVLFVSRLVREKQLSVLVSTFHKLAQIGVPFQGVIVGDGPERSWLESRLPDCVFPGFLVGEELAQSYASSDLFFFPSDTESFGNVTLEAMASGLPCVCADATGSRSLVQPGSTGCLVPVGDVEGFASTIRSLIENPGLRARFGEAARERSLTYGWDEPMQSLLERYRALAG